MISVFTLEILLAGDILSVFSSSNIKHYQGGWDSRWTIVAFFDCEKFMFLHQLQSPQSYHNQQRGVGSEQGTSIAMLEPKSESYT